MDFNRNYSSKQEFFPEVNSGELLVEKGGIMQLSERVKLAQISGYKLTMEKYMQTFDAADGGELVPVPAARRPGYDIADAHRDMMALREKARAAQQKVFEDNKAKSEREYEAKLEEEVQKRIAKKQKTESSPVTQNAGS